MDGGWVESRMRRLVYGVRWDPRRGVYVAYCHDLPEVSGEDEFSMVVAITGSTDAVRRCLAAGPSTDGVA
ncbi:hypothetical protein [Nocardia sp. NPDC057440]|uniref:hypothetical protein n=1 Tax=Nocardia sp. NPDC057440 TaxID=3346134 RepID=UPI00366C5C70